MPDLSHDMKSGTRYPASKLRKVRPGMIAFVRVKILGPSARENTVAVIPVGPTGQRVPGCWTIELDIPDQAVMTPADVIIATQRGTR